MIHHLIEKFDGLKSIETAHAHCDIPCKIYDPAIALVAALSVIRLNDIMEEAAAKTDQSTVALHNTLSRCVAQKEEQSEIVKHEIRVIWGDFIKAPQVEKFPTVHELTHAIMMKASLCKQQAKREDGLALLELVNQFAEIFWQCKGIDTERKVCPYPPAMAVVHPTL